MCRGVRITGWACGCAHTAESLLVAQGFFIRPCLQHAVTGAYCTGFDREDHTELIPVRCNKCYWKTMFHHWGPTTHNFAASIQATHHDFENIAPEYLEQRDFEHISQIKLLQMEAELKIRDSIKAMHAFHYDKLRRFLGPVGYHKVCEQAARFLQEHPFGKITHNVGLQYPPSSDADRFDSTTFSDLPPSYDSSELPLLPETGATEPPAYRWESDCPIADEDYPEDSNRAALVVLQEQQSRSNGDSEDSLCDTLCQLRSLLDLLNTELQQLRSRPYRSNKASERMFTLFEYRDFLMAVIRTELDIVEQQQMLGMFRSALNRTVDVEERRGLEELEEKAIEKLRAIYDGRDYCCIVYNERHCALGRECLIDLTGKEDAGSFATRWGRSYRILPVPATPDILPHDVGLVTTAGPDMTPPPLPATTPTTAVTVDHTMVTYSTRLPDTLANRFPVRISMQRTLANSIWAQSRESSDEEDHDNDRRSETWGRTHVPSVAGQPSDTVHVAIEVRNVTESVGQTDIWGEPLIPTRVDRSRWLDPPDSDDEVSN